MWPIEWHQCQWPWRSLFLTETFLRSIYRIVRHKVRNRHTLKLTLKLLQTIIRSMMMTMITDRFIWQKRQRKRGRAQRVSRPAYALCDCACFLLTYRLAMLLPPTEWPLTSTVRILASLQSLPMQMSQNMWWVTGPKLTIFVAVVTYSSTVLTQPSVVKWEGDI